MIMKSREELKFKVQLDKVHDIDLDADLDIDKTLINRELSQQPALFAWYAVLSELAKNNVLLAKNSLEMLEATIDQDIRRNWDSDRQGKMTETGVQSNLRLNLKYQEMEKNYFNAKKMEGVLGVAKQAFEQRKDMLISIASNMRAESDIDLKINKEKVAKQIARVRGKSEE